MPAPTQAASRSASTKRAVIAPVTRPYVFARRDHPAASNALNSSAPLPIAVTLSPRRPTLGKHIGPAVAQPRQQPRRIADTGASNCRVPTVRTRSACHTAPRRATVVSPPRGGRCPRRALAAARSRVPCNADSPSDEVQRDAWQPRPAKGGPQHTQNGPPSVASRKDEPSSAIPSLGAPLGSPPPEHHPYLVQRDATPKVGASAVSWRIAVGTAGGAAPSRVRVVRATPPARHGELTALRAAEAQLETAAPGRMQERDSSKRAPAATVRAADQRGAAFARWPGGPAVAVASTGGGRRRSESRARIGGPLAARRSCRAGAPPRRAWARRAARAEGAPVRAGRPSAGASAQPRC